jgi:hypothetical protein
VAQQTERTIVRGDEVRTPGKRAQTVFVLFTRRSSRFQGIASGDLPLFPIGIRCQHLILEALTNLRLLPTQNIMIEEKKKLQLRSKQQRRNDVVNRHHIVGFHVDAIYK